MGFLKWFMRDRTVEQKYVQAGAQFGDAVSYIYLGECIGFEGLLDAWGKWEQEYARRGYRTVPLDAFVGLGGYGQSIDHLLGQKRDAEEEPVFHAEIYREDYLGKISPAIDLNDLINGSKESQSANYTLPSTMPREEQDQ